MLENSQPILLNSLIYSKLLGTATTTGFGNCGYSLSVTPPSTSIHRIGLSGVCPAENRLPDTKPTHLVSGQAKINQLGALRQESLRSEGGGVVVCCCVLLCVVVCCGRSL